MVHTLFLNYEKYEVLDLGINIFIIIYSCIDKLFLTCGIRALDLRTHIFPLKIDIDGCLLYSEFCVLYW